jgi:hypothetical protein
MGMGATQESMGMWGSESAQPQAGQKENKKEF